MSRRTNVTPPAVSNPAVCKSFVHRPTCTGFGAASSASSETLAAEPLSHARFCWDATRDDERLPSIASKAAVSGSSGSISGWLIVPPA